MISALRCTSYANLGAYLSRSGPGWHGPWHSREAEQVLLFGSPPTAELLRAAADAALAGAVPLRGNAFKIELARLTLVRALPAS